MDPIIEEFTITLKYQVKVDTETGEMTTKCISRKVDKSNFEVIEDKPRKKRTKKEESSEPQITLEDNKYCLNQAAADLMEVTADSKLKIEYEKINGKFIPVISISPADGNKLTKSLTVACRGSKNSELAKYGNIFTVIPHESVVGRFILKGNSVEEKQGDDVINFTEGDDVLDIELDNIIEDEDANIVEVDSSIFQL